MAFSDLCHISNAFKANENESESERTMEENSMVRDIITKILDDTGPSEPKSTIQPPEKTITCLSTNINGFPKHDPQTNNAFMPSYNYTNTPYFNQNDTFNYNMPNGFNTNGFVSYPENDVTILGVDPVPDTETVTPEQLNLLRLAAQEIGGAQFTTPSPNKFDDKYYNFFEPNQRNSLPDTNMFTNNYNRPNSLNLDMNYNSSYDVPFNQRYPNKFDNGFIKEQNPDSNDILSYLSQMQLHDRAREESLQNDFKMSMEMNGHYQNDEYKFQEERNKLFYNNRNFPQHPNKFNGEGSYHLNDMMAPMSDRNTMGQGYDFSTSTSNSINFKPNGFNQQNEFQRRDMSQMFPLEGYQGNGNERSNFDNNLNRDNNQQALMRQQELARQMNMIIRNRPPPSQLNVDVNFMHENTPFNLGLGALLGPSPPVPPPVLPSPIMDLPLLAPFYAMRNMRGAATSSSILHARLDACYEQWRQLERERKRTEARLALAYPGRAVSSSNSIPVPRLPPCPTRVDRLTVDMLREHTKVLTLMGKMETLRASVCVAQNKKPNKPDDCKITVLKRGQENISSQRDTEKDSGVDPATYDPSSWKDDLNNLSEIAPHSEVESAMLAWRNAVAGVQAARRRELAPHPTHARYMRADPIMQLADAVKQLCVSARRARCAMWCDLTLTVALAPPPPMHPAHTQNETSTQLSTQSMSPKQTAQDTVNTSSTNNKPAGSETNDEMPSSNQTKAETKTENNEKKSNQTEKPEKSQQRRAHTYRNKVNQGRNDFYQKNQRYENRFVHNRHPYHYLATGPIN